MLGPVGEKVNSFTRIGTRQYMADRIFKNLTETYLDREGLGS